MYPKHFCDLFSPDLDASMVFIGMSFAAADQPRWAEIIQPAITSAGLRPYRVDAGNVSDSIMTDILTGLRRARLALFDITADDAGHRNGNVMYELGLAHALRNPEEVLIVRADVRPLLFDVAGIRVHFFEAERTAEARDLLAQLVTGAAQAVDSSKSIALNKAASMLDEVCLGFLHSHAGMEHFSYQAKGAAFAPKAVAARAAIRVLLDLGVLRLVWVRDHQVYAYTWTGFGRALVEFLGFGDLRRTGANETLGYADRRPTPRSKQDEMQSKRRRSNRA